MRGRGTLWVWMIGTAVLLCGCGSKSESVPVDIEVSEEAAEPEKVFVEQLPEEEIPEEDVLLEEEALSEQEEPVSYEVMDVSHLVKLEGDGISAAEVPVYLSGNYDDAPKDTVAYVDSEKKEILETRQVESKVDEADPSTYQVVKREKSVVLTEEIPTEYTDAAGQVRYACRDGVWYEYKYSTGDVTLDDPDEEIALFLLNLDGFYDGYEPVEVVCTEVSDESMQTKYQYHVSYRSERKMDSAPSDVEDLAVSDSRQETSVNTENVEEKVPVLLTEEVGTGEYQYYGWQELNDELCYYDKHGEKVTGEQVIQGIRHVFDSHGVKTSSAGVDVSSSNGSIDWDAVEDERIEYALIRGAYRGAVSGDLILDSRFAENVIGARREGLDVGITLSSQAINEREAVEEASAAVLLARERQITRPIVITVGYANESCTGRADSLSVQDRTACVEAFCRTVQNAGYIPMIRADKSFLENNLEQSILQKYPIDLVQYNSNVTYTGLYEIWQYTAQGNVNGISGNTGLMISYGK